MRSALVLLLFAPALCAAGQGLQALIDAAPAGAVLTPPPGRHAGPIVIDKPLTLDGGGKLVIDGEGKGSVVTVRAGGALLRGLVIRNSGHSNDGMDAGIVVEGDSNRIEDNVLEDVFFGLHVRQGSGNRLRDNRVTGKDLPLGLRGDGLRLWNSHANTVEGNAFRRVRDLTLANSPDNRLVGNTLDDARYAVHTVFSPRTVIERNRFSDTSTGVVVLYSEGVILRGNAISHATDGGGACVTFKDSGEGLVENNTVLHCATGLMANAPLSGERVLTIRGNRFAHNTIGMSFYGEQGGHRILGNRFEHNLVQVVASAPGSTGSANVWHANYWSDYQGFDRNGDGVGDTPYELAFFADRIWMEIPLTKFFANSPAFELIDFLERLAPFSSPHVVLKDTAPQMK
ncbi:MAG: nitrous oxide reductase family maturation protein NosD [Ignavibacteria bacterium]